MLVSTRIVSGAQLYEIAIEAAKIYKTPKVNAVIVHSLFAASDIVIIKQQGRWAQVSFSLEGKQIKGWIKRDRLQAVSKADRGKALAITTEKIDKTRLKSSEIRPHNVFSADNVYGVKVIDTDLTCVKVAKTAFISGCLMNIDLEISGPSTASSVAVMCKGEFELKIKDRIKHLWQEKIIRTPLKEGVGAARVELAVIPLLEKNVTNISMQSHQCRLDRVFSASN